MGFLKKQVVDFKVIERLNQIKVGNERYEQITGDFLPGYHYPKKGMFREISPQGLGFE